jgi:hypothetical protein
MISVKRVRKNLPKLLSKYIQTCSSCPIIATRTSEVLSRHGSGTCCRSLLNFLHGRKMITFALHHESWEKPEVTRSEVWRIWRLGDCLNLVLLQKVLHCEGSCDRVHCHGAGVNCFSMTNCSTLTCLRVMQRATQIAHSPVLRTPAPSLQHEAVI